MRITTNHWLQGGHWFEYKNHQIFYRIDGTGEALVLLHGFPTSSWDWHKVWDGLVADHRVICLDFIGFGFSDKPTSHHYSMIDQADLVECLLEHLDINQYHILAHDIGDTVAQELLARQLDRKKTRIQSCCFLNGGLFPETHRATQVQKLLLSPFGFLIGRLLTFQRFVASFSILFPHTTQPSELEMREFFELIQYKHGGRVTHKIIRYILERREYRERWLSAIQHASCPIRLIDGIADPVSGAHMVARFRELIVLSDIIELVGCGHYPQMEMPAKVLDSYRNFRIK
jgi:pimeloyl-ACP methyl ester carboxylesterase